jgi:hypothetical protein
VVGVLQPVEELIEFREPLLDVPLIVAGFELDVEEDGSGLGLALGVGGDGNLDRRGEVIVVHKDLLIYHQTIRFYFAAIYRKIRRERPDMAQTTAFDHAFEGGWNYQSDWFQS